MPTDTDLTPEGRQLVEDIWFSSSDNDFVAGFQHQKTFERVREVERAAERRLRANLRREVALLGLGSHQSVARWKSGVWRAYIDSLLRERDGE